MLPNKVLLEIIASSRSIEAIEELFTVQYNPIGWMHFRNLFLIHLIMMREREMPTEKSTTSFGWKNSLVKQRGIDSLVVRVLDRQSRDVVFDSHSLENLFLWNVWKYMEMKWIFALSRTILFNQNLLLSRAKQKEEEKETNNEWEINASTINVAHSER